MSNPAPPGGVNVGFDNYVPWWRVVAILLPNSMAAARYRERAEREGKLISVCAGRRRRSMIITDTDQVIVSMVSTETLMVRLDAKRIENNLIICLKKEDQKLSDELGAIYSSEQSLHEHSNRRRKA